MINSNSVLAYYTSSQDGDLTKSNHAADPTSMLHSTQLKQMPLCRNEAQLGVSLDLVLGGNGVIGPMMSVVSGGEEIGDGSIGWN